MGVSLEDSNTPKATFREIFNRYFPIYLSYGMSSHEYWDEEPELATAYREAHELRLDRKNQELWLEGVYMKKALESTVGNMFLKKGAKPMEYPKEPLAITEKEAKAREEKEAKERFERMKSMMIAKSKTVKKKG